MINQYNAPSVYIDPFTKDEFWGEEPSLIVAIRLFLFWTSMWKGSMSFGKFHLQKSPGFVRVSYEQANQFGTWSLSGFYISAYLTKCIQCTNAFFVHRFMIDYVFFFNLQATTTTTCFLIDWVQSFWTFRGSTSHPAIRHRCLRVWSAGIPFLERTVPWRMWF